MDKESMISEQVNRLKACVIANKDRLPYLNLDANNQYKGWVSDFHFTIDGNESMHLDLSVENDLFLLFVLAIAWSRNGRWENAACFTAYLKVHHSKGYDHPTTWKNPAFISERQSERFQAASDAMFYCKGMTPRAKISFRKDIYESIGVLANHWEAILACLNKSEMMNDYRIFVRFMRGIAGLGSGKKRMNIKILLILRELRCQHIYRNIQGESCCVADRRVEDACQKLKIKLPASKSSIETLLAASQTIYSYFGDLYDLPLFAYEDLIGLFG